MQNRIDAALTAENRDRILENIAEIKALLPFLIDLSPEDRQSLPKIDDKSGMFVSGSLQPAERGDQYFSFSKPVIAVSNSISTNLNSKIPNSKREYSGSKPELSR